jgi:hypothetical protein
MAKEDGRRLVVVMGGALAGRFGVMVNKIWNKIN